MSKLCTVFKIVLIFLSALLAIFGLIFIFMEGRMLFSLDWTVYDNQAGAFFRYLFRLLIALFALSTAVIQIVNCFIKSKTLSMLLAYFFVALFIVSIIICVFAANYVDIACIVIGCILFAVKTATVILQIKKPDDFACI